MPILFKNWASDSVGLRDFKFYFIMTYLHRIVIMRLRGGGGLNASLYR